MGPTTASESPAVIVNFWTVSGLPSLQVPASIVLEKDFNASGGWPEYYTWGREDPDFYDYFVKNEYNIIREREIGLIHMWHPPMRDV